MTIAQRCLTILVAIGLLASWPIGVVAQSEQDLGQHETDALQRHIEDVSFGLRSVVPADWQDAGGGIYVRGATPDDLTLMALQSAPTDLDGLWQALLPQFALSDIPETTDDLVTDSLDWALYAFEAELPDAVMAAQLALAEQEGVTYLVLVMSDELESDALRAQVFLPAVEAFEALGSEVPPDSATVAGPVELESILAEFVGDADGGVVGLLIRDGVTTTGAAGDADAEGDPMQTDAAFRVGSISKPFVATMVLQLVDEGLLDLDAPLSTYLPETPIGGDVTIRSLLAQRSGIPSYTNQPRFLPEVLEDLERSFSVDEVLDYVAGVPGAEPDVVHAYSNTNYILLGQLLEAVGGADLETTLQTRIVEPLGLGATTFAVGDARRPDRLAGGWSAGAFEGLAAAPYEAVSSSAWSAGALISTASDLATFLAALFDGELISDELLVQMLDTGPEGYGLGLASTDYMLGDVGSDGFYGHGGGIPGYLSFMARSPGSGDTVVLLSNNDARDPHRVGADILRAWAAADG